jgi:RNA polymerase I-specific transcription initiation factor RRN3
VEIQVEFEELEAAEEEDPESNGAVFDIDPFDTDATVPDDISEDEAGLEDGDYLDNLSDLSSEAEGPLTDDEESKPKERQINFPHIRDMVEKLDSIMKILFEHFSDTPTSSTPQIEGPPSPDEEEVRVHRTTQFFNLLSIFDKVILRTLKSKCIQFLIFWYTSLDAQYLDVFQGMLISKAFIEMDTPLVIRVAATSYIASFVSRAEFANRTHTRHIVRLFRQHLEDQLETCHMEASSRPSASQYTTFYAVAQALFLIFCFRWRDLVDTEDEQEEVGALSLSKKKWIQDLEIVSKIINSVLNPLRVRSLIPQKMTR